MSESNSAIERTRRVPCCLICLDLHGQPDGSGHVAANVRVGTYSLKVVQATGSLDDNEPTSSDGRVSGLLLRVAVDAFRDHEAYHQKSGADQRKQYPADDGHRTTKRNAASGVQPEPGTHRDDQHQAEAHGHEGGTTVGGTHVRNLRGSPGVRDGKERSPLKFRGRPAEPKEGSRWSR